MTKGLLRSHAGSISVAARLCDVLVVISCGLIAYPLTNSWTGDLPPPYAAALIIAGLLVLVVFPLTGLYDTWRGQSRAAELRAALWAWTLTLAALLVLASFAKETATYSRAWVLAWWLTGSAALLLMRLALRSILGWARSRGFNTRSLVVVGSGALADLVVHRLNSATDSGFRLLGVFGATGTMADRKNCPRLGDIDDLEEYVAANPVDQVWIAVPWDQHHVVAEAFAQLQSATADIRMVPDIFSYELLNHSISEVAGMPVLNLSASPMRGINRVVKSLEDRLLAALILLLISPLMISIALAVKLSSPGPVLFRQQRHGWDGRLVEVWKFRTMKVHQEKDGHCTQACRNDPRVTALGRFLRRTSLDELPQFMNVLQGRMSIVGPRPHAVPHNEEFRSVIPGYMWRHKVKPGITGWAQVNGHRGETDTLEKMEHRVRHDLYYIDNWSLGLDLKIILLTLLRGFYHKNAY